MLGALSAVRIRGMLLRPASATVVITSTVTIAAVAASLARWTRLVGFVLLTDRCYQVLAELLTLLDHLGIGSTEIC